MLPSFIAFVRSVAFHHPDSIRARHPSRRADPLPQKRLQVGGVVGAESKRACFEADHDAITPPDVPDPAASPTPSVESVIPRASYPRTSR